MLTFKMIKDTLSEVVYEYYPEGGSAVGIVSHNKKSNTNSIVNLSVDDRHERYAMKMLAKLREFAHNGKFEVDGIIAWY